MPASRPSLVRNPDLDYLIVVPTCADPAILVPTVRRLLLYAEPRTRIVLSVNSADSAKADHAVAACRALPVPPGVCLDLFEDGKGPVGFAPAVNAGLRWAQDASGVGRFGVEVFKPGLATLNIILNDDVRVTAGWQRGLQAAVETPTVRIPADPVGPDGKTRPDRDAKAYGKIGLVGPVSDRVAGMQAVTLNQPVTEATVDTVAAQHRLTTAGEVLAADFLSGFCVGLSFDALADLAETWLDLSGPMVEDGAIRRFATTWGLFDERFRIGGYEDNDLCVRAELAGWRCAIAGEVFVHHLGHQTIDNYPGQLRGMANRLTYLQKWENDPRVSGRKLVACYRVKFETVQDVHYLRTSIARLGSLADGIALLLTNNPLEIQGDPAFQAEVGSLPDADQRMLQGCSGADVTGVRRAVEAWVRETWGSATKRPRALAATVDVWQAPWNERDERNRAIEMAEGLGADWILSVDADESIEPRVDRTLLDRIMGHPDPMVRSFDFSWLNHWDSPRLVRQDPPWGDGGTYRGGMRGFRMWRVCKAAPRRILSGNEIGLHCGNVPMHDPLACRVSGLRFRHYGYLRLQDRARRFERYTRLDPNPDAVLTGGGYGHLVHEEGMRVAPLVVQDGIGLSMLVHAGERVEDVARHLDVLHALVDRAVLVWTSPIDEGDEHGGVPEELREIARLFGAEIVLHPLDDDFAGARNAGLDALRPWAEPDPRTGRPPTLGWVWSVDPDEHLQDWFSDSVAIRRMAEASDVYGWMLRFANLRPDGGGAATMSETIRMVRIDPGNLMRWHGRVHEGFDRALSAIAATGERPTLRTAPFVAVNPGLGGDDVALERKTRFYQRLLLKTLDEDWDNPNAWVALGMQFENDGHTAKAVGCYERALLCEHGEGYLPYRELMLHHLRRARVFAARSMELVGQGHPYHAVAAECYRWLRENAQEQPKVGLARRGQAPPASDVALPWHPKADGPKGHAPAEHPLSALLGPSWKWLSRPEREAVVLLHDSGAYASVGLDLLDRGFDSGPWNEVAGALAEAVEAGATGEVLVEVRIEEDGTVHARPVRPDGSPVTAKATPLAAE